METIGNRIVNNRHRLGITQEELAKRLGVTAQAVSKWECDASCPDISLLPVLAEIFSITTDELLTGNAPNTVRFIKQEKDPSDMILRITVYSDDETVKINIPMPIAEAAVRAGVSVASVSGNESLSEVSFDELIGAIKDGAIGEIITIETKDGDKIVISAE